MAQKYKFPRVDVASYARVKSTARPETPDTTVLFMPIMSSIGPSGEIVKIHDLDEYVSYFGTPAFNMMGISAIALTRWLNAGGTLYAYRLVERGVKNVINNDDGPQIIEYGPEFANYALKNGGQTVFGFTAKYSGDAYNNLCLRIEPVAVSGDTYNITVWLSSDTSTRETYSRIVASQIPNVLNASSELVRDFQFDFSGLTVELGDENTRPFTLRDLVGTGMTFKMSESNNIFNAGALVLGCDVSPFLKGTKSYYELMTDAWSIAIDDKGEIMGELTRLFTNVSATTVDTILDPGYSAELKVALYDAIHYVLQETAREDLFVAFSTCIIEERAQEDGTKCADGKIKRPGEFSGFGLVPTYENGKRTNQGIPYTNDDTGETDGVDQVAGVLNGWFAVYDQYLVVTDTIYNSGADLYVPLSVMYAQNSAYNDLVYSMHRPTAGETYGRITGYKSINFNPNVSQKDQLFRKRINYAEQSARSVEIMTNRTFYHPDETGVQSPLDFVNNVRVKNKIVRDLRKILRKYLYEYADGDTLLRCQNECNAYINGWINNKALTTGSITIEIDPYTEEYVNAALFLKFRGCVEFIDVSIYLD